MTLLSLGSPDFRSIETANKSVIKTGQKTVAIASTAEQFPAQAIPTGYSVVIKGLDANTNKVHVAKSAADAQVDANAYELGAGQFLILKITNLNLLWLNANVNGQGVTFAVEVDA